MLISSQRPRLAPVAWCAAALILMAATGRASGQSPVVSTYLGGEGADRLTGAAVLADGSIIVAGLFDATAPANGKGDPTGGVGRIIKLAPDGQQVLATAQLASGVSDLDVDSNGRIFVTGGFGSACYSPALGKPVWTNDQAGSASSRITATGGGGAAVLVGHDAHILDQAGRVTRSFRAGGGYCNDIAYHPGLQLLYTTGFYNRRGHRYPVQVAYVYAYHTQGEKAGSRAWKAYDWGGREVDDQGLMADTRGYRVTIGGDGKLYVAGESAGGNTIWTRQSQALTTKVQLAKGDQYQHAYNTRANHITAVMRLNPQTGVAEAGTLLLARLSNGRGNTIRPRALAADANGRVWVGGASTSYPPISKGAFAGEYDGGGAYLTGFDSQFARIHGTKLAKGWTLALAASHGRLIVVGAGDDGLPTHRPTRAKPEGEDGWLVVFSADTGTPAPATRHTPAAGAAANPRNADEQPSSDDAEAQRLKQRAADRLLIIDR